MKITINLNGNETKSELDEKVKASIKLHKLNEKKSLKWLLEKSKKIVKVLMDNGIAGYLIDTSIGRLEETCYITVQQTLSIHLDQYGNIKIDNNTISSQILENAVKEIVLMNDQKTIVDKGLTGNTEKYTVANKDDEEGIIA